jgi:hypothetical protein
MFGKSLAEKKAAAALSPDMLVLYPAAMGRSLSKSAPQAPVVRDRPEPEILPKMNSSSVEEYIALASEIGLSTVATRILALKNYLQKEEIPVFNYQKVVEYMNNLVAMQEFKEPIAYQHYYWGWSALREKDLSKQGGSTQSNGSFSDRLYQKAVPLDTLRIVKKIETEFPDQSFFVSDIYLVPKPDPFLAVGLPYGEKFVIHVWDEPDFKLT